MPRTRPEPPDFDDQGPESQASWGPQSSGNGGPGDDHGELPLGPLGDYQLQGQDASFQPEAEAAPPEPSGRRLRRATDERDARPNGNHRHRAPDTLATRAARAAFKAGSAAGATTAFRDNGRHTVALGTAAGAAASVAEAHELLDALARAAAATEDEAEALGLAAAMVPVALDLVPNAYRALWPAIPTLVRGTMGLARLLYREPGTRPRLGLLPAILVQTTAWLARHTARGSAIHPQLIARTLAESTTAALAPPSAATSPAPHSRAAGAPAPRPANGRTRVRG